MSIIIWAAIPPSTPAFLFVVPPQKKSSVQVGLQIPAKNTQFILNTQ